MKKEKIYSLTVKGDNTLKTFFERFYVLPKEGKDVNDNITMNRKWKIKMYKNDH